MLAFIAAEIEVKGNEQGDANKRPHNELPEDYRQVITLFYLEQKSYEEVAALLDQPLGTVKTNLFRARKELLRIGARQMRPVPVSSGRRLAPSPDGCVSALPSNPLSSLRTLPTSTQLRPMDCKAFFDEKLLRRLHSETRILSPAEIQERRQRLQAEFEAGMARLDWRSFAPAYLAR